MSTNNQATLTSFFRRSPLSTVHQDDERPRGTVSVSPEEQFIQQRGKLRSSPRRKALTSNSPRLKVTEMVDLISDSPNDKSGWTPLRRAAQVDGIKRRLQMEEKASRMDLESEPQDESNEQDDEEFVPSKKKRRTKTKKTEQPNLHKRLSALSREQLAEIIEDLVKDHPELEQEIAVPSPDIGSLLENLELFKGNIYKSFPYSRWGSGRDAFCYRRVKTHLDSFVKSCIDQGRQLEVLESWRALIDYILKAWEFVHDLPNWDNPDHNKSKNRCFKALSGQCKRAISKSHLTQAEYKKILSRVEEAVEVDDNILPCVELIKKKSS
ncbi:uncharacterized protein LOC133174323 [Saccostrea echinata]|uniref:uncharacterized protein LOC133174323 n=1 Tax=Saccostrea echinata TaxID=191078 RepID=UPI002A7F7444|nr:uncharacterized protein LOC133174323 [Saccostrea echinata]XP_061165399.1 uncharacterized protein LOC133174323 [Saccostrea echinata]